MKKILIIHHAAEYGGGSKAAFQIAKMLRDDYIVEFLIPDYCEDFYKILKSEDYNVHLFHGYMGGIYNYSGGPRVISRTFLKMLFKIPTSAMQLYKFMNKHEFDICIINSSVISWAVHILKSKYKICFIRETVHKNILYKLEKKYVDKFDTTCFISKHDLELWDLKQTNKLLVYDCVDVEDICMKRSNKTIKNILYLGGDSDLKGWQTIKKLIENHPEYNYHVAGKVSENNIINAEHVNYYQMVNHVESLYHIADVILLPSTSPHQLMPIFEAGLYQVPVITTDFEIIHEHISNNFNGILVPLNDVSGIVKALVELNDDYDLKKYIIENNYKKSISHSYKNVRKRFLYDLENLLKGLTSYEDI